MTRPRGITEHAIEARGELEELDTAALGDVTGGQWGPLACDEEARAARAASSSDALARSDQKNAPVWERWNPFSTVNERLGEAFTKRKESAGRLATCISVQEGGPR